MTRVASLVGSIAAPAVGMIVLLLATAYVDASAQIVSPNIHVSAGACPEIENQPSIATQGQNAVAVWYRHRGDDNVCSAISRDGGLTWTPAAIARDPANETISGHPTVCMDGSGTAYFAMSAGAQEPTVIGQTIFIYKGSFSETSWSWQRIANATPYVSFGERRFDGVKIICDRRSDILYLVYARGPRGYEGRIQFVRSTDRGASWSAPQVLSGAPCNTAQMALGPDGELYVAWEDYGQRAIVGRKSMDSGETFGSEFLVSAIQENLGFGPPGWTGNGRSPTLPNMPCMDFPAFIGLAVDTSSGPRRGAMYVTWTEHALGTVEKPRRGIYEIEPNDPYLSLATQLEIGDQTAGFMGSADEPPFTGDCDLFTFEGTAGTTIQITGHATECLTSGGCFERAMNFDLFCGSDTTALTTVGCGQIHAPFEPIPPFIYTLPTTGRYYLLPGCSSSGNISYGFELLEYVPAPSQPARDHRDIVLSSSTDGGATWSAKVRVNDDLPMFDNSIPAITVDGQGLVYVAWYDRRDVPECGGLVHTYWTWSDDGGQTFASSMRVSEAASDGGGFTGFFQFDVWRVGDHMALHAEEDRVYLLWTQVPIGGGGEIYGVIITDVSTPVLVSGLRVEASAGGADLRWWVSEASDVAEFRVHRATGAGEYSVIARVAPGPGGEHRWRDRSLSPGVLYRYKLEAVTREGGSAWEGPVELLVPLPAGRLAWRGAAPNPFDDEVVLDLETPDPAGTTVEVYDVTGHLVISLPPQKQADRVVVRWNGRDGRNRLVAPGVYLVRARHGAGTAVRQVVRMK